MNPIKKFLIKYLFRQEEWQWHGYSNKNTWVRQTDPKVFIAASNVKHFYRGYPYIVRLPQLDVEQRIFIIAWHINRDLAASTDYITGWIKQNCVGNYRFDSHRVSYRYDEWVMDELGGGDEMFVAFDNEQDAVMFSLKWA